jgi:hypothetical protein
MTGVMSRSSESSDPVDLPTALAARRHSQHCSSVNEPSAPDSARTRTRTTVSGDFGLHILAARGGGSAVLLPAA